MRASAVLKRQSIVVSAVLRSWFQAVSSATRVAPSAMRRSKHWPFSTLSSISGHVEPTPVLRGVIDLQLVGQALGLSRLESLLQRPPPLGVEAIHHHRDLPPSALTLIHPPFTHSPQPPPSAATPPH